MSFLCSTVQQLGCRVFCRLKNYCFWESTNVWNLFWCSILSSKVYFHNTSVINKSHLLKYVFHAHHGIYASYVNSKTRMILQKLFQHFVESPPPQLVLSIAILQSEYTANNYQAPWIEAHHGIYVSSFENKHRIFFKKSFQLIVKSSPPQFVLSTLFLQPENCES